MALPTSGSIHPFKLSIAQSSLDDLQMRLRLARWPDRETVTDWSQGVPLAEIQGLCEYWNTEYDWRRCEALLNSYPQFTTTIDGVEFYFLHIRSKHEDALPLMLTHGWPGSILEFRHVIDKLVDPESHGGSPGDAFHLVIPALPGYAFSGKPTKNGWDYHRTARAWAELMQRLGYADDRWVAQGGDWGAHVVASLGHQAPKGLKSVHFNSIFFEPKVISAPADNWTIHANLVCRKKFKSQSATKRVKSGLCIWTAAGMPGMADTLYNSQRDRRLSVTGLQTHQSHRLPGFTKNTETGLIMMAMWRRYSARTRCSIRSCCTGSPILEHLLLVIIGSASSIRRHG